MKNIQFFRINWNISNIPKILSKSKTISIVHRSEMDHQLEI